MQFTNVLRLCCSIGLRASLDQERLGTSKLEAKSSRLVDTRVLQFKSHSKKLKQLSKAVRLHTFVHLNLGFTCFAS